MAFPSGKLGNEGAGRFIPNKKEVACVMMRPRTKHSFVVKCVPKLELRNEG
jgi:hypothetical protein